MNRGKILLLVLGPIALIASLYFASGGPGSVSVNSTIQVVDVTTGKISRLKTGKGLFLPAANEEGQVVLFPVTKDESGKWMVPETYRDALRQSFGKDPRLKVDLETFVVAAS